MASELVSILRSAEFASALGGAFAGVLAGYAVQMYQEKRKEESERYNLINTTRFVLGSQLESLDEINRQYLGYFRDRPDRHLAMASFMHAFTDLRVNPQPLLFLVKVNAPEVLGMITIAERSFLSVIKTVEARSGKFAKLDRVAHRLAFDPTTGNSTYSKTPEVDGVVHELKLTTDNLYAGFDEARVRLKFASDALFTVGKRLFPDLPFIAYFEDGAVMLPSGPKVI